MVALLIPLGEKELLYVTELTMTCVSRQKHVFDSLPLIKVKFTYMNIAEVDCNNIPKVSRRPVRLPGQLDK